MRSWTNTKTRHGTTSGYKLHQILDEDPCDACYRAKQAYDKARTEIPAHKKRSRDRSAAQARALRRIKDNHYDEYVEYYQEELARLEDG